MARMGTNETFTDALFIKALDALAAPYTTSDAIAKYLGFDRNKIQKKLPIFEGRQTCRIDRNYRPYRIFKFDGEKPLQPSLPVQNPSPGSRYTITYLARLLAKAKIKAGAWDPGTGGERAFDRAIERLVKDLAVQYADEVTPEIVVAYIGRRREAKIRDVTIRTELLRLESVLYYGRETKNLHLINPMKVWREFTGGKFEPNRSAVSPAEFVDRVQAATLQALSPWADRVVMALKNMTEAVDGLTAALAALKNPTKKEIEK